MPNSKHMSLKVSLPLLVITYGFLNKASRWSNADYKLGGRFDEKKGLEGDRILFLDLLRVIGLTMVILSHVLITIGPPWSQIGQPYFGIRNFYWATWGELGVTLFLIVSGLSLECRYGTRPIPYGVFLLKRITRIYPVYYMSLVVGLGMQFMFAEWAHLRHGQQFILLPRFGLLDLFMTLTGFNAFAGRWGGALVWSSWFIGLIVSLYLVYPAISYGIKRSPWLTLFLLFFISATSRIIVGRSEVLPGNPMEWFPGNRLFEFGLGVFLIRTVGVDLFLGLNKLLKRVPALTFLSALSFPMFLIHDPLRRLIYLGPKEATSLILGLPLFLLLSFTLSMAVLAIQERIEGKLRERFPLQSIA